MDELITIDGCLTAKSLLTEFEQFLAHYPDLLQIHQSMNFGQMLEHLCTVQQIPRILLQKLTILEIQLPNIFEQTLFSTWLGSMLAKEMKHSTEQIHNTFYVGLLHDLGLLHIDPALISKQGGYNEQEWNIMKRHMMISLAIATLIHPFDEEVYRGIKEHHERCDGTGYPKELHKEQLCNCGQLIGLADIICHIRTLQYLQSGKSMANIMPYIQINLQSFKFESYQAMYAIVHRAKLEINDLLNRKDFLSLPKRLITQRVRITDDGFNETHTELQELDDMHYELLWLFKKVFRIIPDFLAEELPANSKLLPQFNAQTEIMQQNLLQAWTDYN